jgi:hypothetical protein
MEVRAMANQIVNELRTTTDAVWARLSAQLHGMESCMERSDVPEAWTTRQVLCHLLFEPGWRPKIRKAVGLLEATPLVTAT